MTDGKHEAVTNSGIVQLNNSGYDIIRIAVEKVFPALGVLYAALAVFWGWGYTVEVSGTFAALAVFGGVVLSLARKGYSATDTSGPYDGEIAISGVSEDGAPIAQIQLTEDAQQNFLTKPVLKIKGFDENA